MTDRYNAFTVVLEHDIRDDDAEALINAIKQLRGVRNVTPHIADINAQIAEERVRAEYAKKLWSVLYPPKDSNQ